MLSSPNRHAGLKIALVMTAVAVVAGCAGEGRDDDGRLQAVATTGMIADMVGRVGGERVRVQGLMGPGIDPHLYRASAGDVRTLSGADIIFYNGLHLEAAMGDMLEQMHGRIQTVAVTAGIDRGVLLAPPEFQGAYDPHVWFDVSLWMQAVEAVERVLSARDSAGAATYRSNSRTYLAELDSLHRWVQARAQEVPVERRVLVTAHDAFNYFGRAYEFEVKGLQGISTVSEAGTADVQGLADLIVGRRIPAIFIETSIPRRTIAAVQAAARSRGFEPRIGSPLFSDAMGDAGTPEGTYIGMVRHNVNTIVDALLDTDPAS